jgi:hypothetical protein
MQVVRKGVGIYIKFHYDVAHHGILLALRPYRYASALIKALYENTRG